MEVTRRVFYSFKFDDDFFRVQQLRQIGILEGNQPVTTNAWEEVQRGGDVAIKRWIHSAMEGKSCLVCFVGQNTWKSDWVKYELKYAWEQGKGVVAVRIHGLKNQLSQTSIQGANPLDAVNVSVQKIGLGMTLANPVSLSNVANIHSPYGLDSKAVYTSIANNLEAWVEDAISNRARYR